MILKLQGCIIKWTPLRLQVIRAVPLKVKGVISINRCGRMWPGCWIEKLCSEAVSPVSFFHDQIYLYVYDYQTS